MEEIQAIAIQSASREKSWIPKDPDCGMWWSWATKLCRLIIWNTQQTKPKQRNIHSVLRHV